VECAYVHRDQVGAAREVPSYPTTVETDVRRLQISPGELRRKAGIPWLVAWHFLRNPHIIPRPDLWPYFEDALLLPRGFFTGKTRGSYGEQCTQDRLVRYSQLDLCKGWTLQKILNKSDHKARASLLALIQRELDSEDCTRKEAQS